jgi:hypothetical protein
MRGLLSGKLAKNGGISRRHVVFIVAIPGDGLGSVFNHNLHRLIKIARNVTQGIDAAAEFIR